MEKYIWCTPILPGKTSAITNEWTQTTFDLTDPETRQEIEMVYDRCGLRDFNLWIQHTHLGDLLLFYWDMEDWDHMWSEYRAILAEKNPRTLLVREQFLDALGIDLAEKDAIPRPEMLGHNEFGKLPASQVVRFAQAWPVLPEHESHRREVVESFSSENRRKFKRLCRHLGLIALSRGFAKSGSQTYYIVYGECDLNRWDRYEEFLDGKHKREEWVWETLSEDTGLTREQLIPHIEWVLDRAPITISK